jgi:prepilin-type N-terminal cleavage/methylation domain-containing protein
MKMNRKPCRNGPQRRVRLEARLVFLVDRGVFWDRLVDKAFTLVELLVVVAIVVLLGALALPAMSHTRNQSQTAVDIYNSRQLMAAAALYAADQNESLPGNGWGTASDCWAHAANVPVYGNATAMTFPMLLSNQVEFCKRGQLYPYVRSLNVFKCPIDATNQLYFARNIYFTSYIWNGAVSAYGNLTLGSTSFKISQFKPNSILQWEADEQLPFFFNDCSEYPDEGISGRHGTGATVGLVSGATQRIALNRWYTSSYAGQQGQRGTAIPRALMPTPAWCNPGTRDGLPQ